MATRTQTLALAKLRDKAAAQPGTQADNQGRPNNEQAQGAVVQLHSTQLDASSVPTMASALPPTPASSSAADLRQEETRQDDNRQPGRPPVDTTQISLRLPRKWEAILRRRAAEASLRTGRTVTPQQVILQVLGATIPNSDGGTLDG